MILSFAVFYLSIASGRTRCSELVEQALHDRIFDKVKTKLGVKHIVSSEEAIGLRAEEDKPHTAAWFADKGIIEFREENWKTETSLNPFIGHEIVHANTTNLLRSGKKHPLFGYFSAKNNSTLSNIGIPSPNYGKRLHHDEIQAFWFQGNRFLQKYQKSKDSTDLNEAIFAFNHALSAANLLKATTGGIKTLLADKKITFDDTNNGILIRQHDTHHDGSSIVLSWISMTYKGTDYFVFFPLQQSKGAEDPNNLSFFTETIENSHAHVLKRITDINEKIDMISKMENSASTANN